MQAIGGLRSNGFTDDEISILTLADGRVEESGEAMREEDLELTTNTVKEPLRAGSPGFVAGAIASAYPVWGRGLLLPAARLPEQLRAESFKASASFGTSGTKPRSKKGRSWWASTRQIRSAWSSRQDCWRSKTSNGWIGSSPAKAKSLVLKVRPHPRLRPVLRAPDGSRGSRNGQPPERAPHREECSPF